MTKLTPISSLSLIKKNIFSIGWVAFPFFLFSGCALPLKQNPPTASHPSPPRIILVDTPASLSIKALLLGEDEKAIELARAIHNRQERDALLSLIKLWSLNRQSELIKERFDNGNKIEAFDLLMKIRTKEPELYRDLLLTFRPEGLLWILNHQIRFGQEKRAIQTMSMLQPFKRSPFKTEISVAYAHWSLRRFWKHRYHESLELANQALKANPKNRLAQETTKKILAIRDANVNRGLIAYRHQHLEKAIRLWKWALAIDPSNEETKKYILKAEELLTKVKSLKGQEDRVDQQVNGGKK